METTQTALHHDVTAPSSRLYIAFELSKGKWKLALNDGSYERIKIKEVSSKDFDELVEWVRWAEDYFGLADDYEIFSCYEAGLDGFWVHRRLAELGFQNVVIDAASLEVKQKKKRKKTDRLDARRLVRHLMRYHAGDRRVFSTCQVPSLQDEDDRRIERELTRLKQERTGHINRIKGLLATRGLFVQVNDELVEQLEVMRGEDGQRLGRQLIRELRRQYRRLQRVEADIKEVEDERAEAIEARREDPKIQKVEQLCWLRGIGEDSAWLLVMEMFGWRQFDNRAQIGSYSGLIPCPWNTGQTDREQGITKAGNKWVRGRMVQLAWLWLQYQPDSQLSRWWRDKYDEASPRQKNIGIIALARKLLIRLWRFVEDGEVPNGAIVRPV